MVAVINSQELINKGLWNYRPTFLDGSKDAKSIYRFTEEIFNESIKQGTFSPVFDRLELAERMGVSEKTVQRAISKLMANQKAYVEKVSKGQYQATLFNTNIDLPADYIIKNFELETKLLTELEKQQQRASNRACKINKQIKDENTSTSLLSDNESKLETKPTSLEKPASQLSIETNVTVNSVAASRPTSAVQRQVQQGQQIQDQQGQQTKTNLASSNKQLKNKSNANESLFAKRLVTEQQRADDLFAQLEDEQQDQLIELTTVIESFWEKTGKLELLKEQWKEYYCNLDWYEFLTNKSMEAIKLAYLKDYEKLLSQTKLSIDEVKTEAITNVITHWENINNISQENIIIPPTILSVGTDNKIDLASLSASGQSINKEPTRFDRITANFIKNENMPTNDESQSIKLDTSNSNQATTNFNSNKKLNVRQLMKQSRETKNVNEPAIKPLKKEDKNVLKTSPYPEKPSGFTHVGESLFAKSLGLDKINLNQNVDTSSVSNTNEIAVIGININQAINQSNQSNQSKSSSDNFSNFSNNDVLGQECPQIDDQVHNNQNDQAINKLRLVSGHECPQINDQFSNQADNLQNDQFDQLSNNSITNTKEISGHECPQNVVEAQESDQRFPTRVQEFQTDKRAEQLAKANESTTAKVIAMPQLQQITGVVAIPVSITTNVTNKVATTTSSVIAVATSHTTSTVPTNMHMRVREVKVLEVNNNLNNNLKTLKTLKTSLIDNNTVSSSSTDANSLTSITSLVDMEQDQEYQQNTETQSIEDLTNNKKDDLLETKENKIDKTTKRKKKNKKIGSNVAGNVSDGVGNSEGQKTLSEASIDESAMRKRLEMDKVVHKDEFRLWRIVGGDYKLERDENGNWMLPNKKGTLPKSEYSFWDIASFAQSQSTIAKPIAYAVGSYYRGDNDDVLKNHFQQSRNSYVGSSGRTVELTDEDKARINQQQIELNRMLLKEELMVQLWDKLAVNEQQKLVNEEISRFSQLFPQHYQNWTHQMLINHNREIVKARLAEEEILRRESQVSLAS